LTVALAISRGCKAYEVGFLVSIGIIVALLPALRRWSRSSTNNRIGISSRLTMKEKLDLVTTDFVYVRWLGDRKEARRLRETHL
jgi:hypothetical protein